MRWDAQDGFDRDEALHRLQEHPEVMPPNPEPYRASKRMDALGRTGILLAVAAAGVALPVLVAFAVRR